ncbi:MAG: hypothetical protein ACK4RK_06395 [Gemmataceae bacterium]
MLAETFAEDGIRFRYPSHWQLERNDNEDGWTVSIQSPDTAFLMLALNTEMPTIEELADTALGALREEYPDLEADEIVEPLAGQPAIGHDIRFFSFDLTNTCWTRSFYSPYGTVLLLCQVNDLEEDSNEPILRAICQSLEVTEE